MTQAGGNVRLRETGSSVDRRRAVHAFAQQPLGIGEVDLDAHRSRGGIFRFADPGHGSRELPATECVDGDRGRVADVGDHDVAVGNLHHHAHQVRPLHRQQRRLATLGRRSDEGTRVKRAMRDHAIEGRDDPGVLNVDPGLRQPRLGHATAALASAASARAWSTLALAAAS